MARNITTDAVAKFMNHEKFSSSNTKVIPSTSETEPTILTLFGNEIAYLYKGKPDKLVITNAGYETSTTKERLNGLPNVSISQKKGIWYLNGSEWNGEKTFILPDGSWKYKSEKQKSDKKPTKIDVIFLKNNDEIYAFFPSEVENKEKEMYLSYSTIGQHSSASIDYALESIEASEEEYSSLKSELESIGYDLTILGKDAISKEETKKPKQMKIGEPQQAFNLVLKHGLDNLSESLEGTYGSDLHNELYNADYFIVGRGYAEEFLNKVGTFNAIAKIKDYEQSNFGELYTDFSEPEKVANMYAYIVGEEILNESTTLRDNWDNRLSEDDIKAIAEEIRGQKQS